ncbi:ketopantoate reductase family protein [Alkalihalobacillus deserti]|uniref:ketopantoate reductase family protein n=1 Tax=Alkalihalobacillus deserti TaxID=2879466 RepID=UPI001D15520D|nr:ketopantoate reductase family protein [Alkalihalobacillus deserti]
MKIAVIGAGAVGGYIGALLKQAGSEVTFIARGKHLKKMNEEGLLVKHHYGTFKVYEHFTDNFSCIKEADLLIFTVKSTETEEVCEQIKPYIKKNCYILCLQNGVVNEEILCENFGDDSILSGSAYVTVKVQESGIISQSGKHIFFIGGLKETQKEFIDRVIDLFQKAGIRSKYSNNIIEKKWEKSLWNVTFNPLSAVTNATVGQILDNERLSCTSKSILRELVQVAKSVNIEITQETIDNVFRDAEIARTHKTSMLQDRERGKKMEVEALCGYFVKLGNRSGVDVPVLSTIYAVLSFIDEVE